jgi:hypothetical protein
MSKFIFLTPIYWDGSKFVDGKYKIAMNVTHIKQFMMTDDGYSLVSLTDAPLGSDMFHKFKESAGEIMSLIMED